MMVKKVLPKGIFYQASTSAIRSFFSRKTPCRAQHALDALLPGQDDRERVHDGTAFSAFPASSSTATAVLASEVLPPPPPPECVPKVLRSRQAASSAPAQPRTKQLGAMTYDAETC